jgi:hypothetical protein
VTRHGPVLFKAQQTHTENQENSDLGIEDLSISIYEHYLPKANDN